MSDKVKCPKCGSLNGYFTKRRVTLNVAYDFDGEPWDSEIDGDSNASGRLKRCLDCKKDITKFVDAAISAAKGDAS